MSLLDELSGELSSVRQRLPLPALRHAATGIRSANDRLIHAIRLAATVDFPATAIPLDVLGRLGRATTHLESGAGLLMRAEDEIAAYLQAIGHQPTARQPFPHQPEAFEPWWPRRVRALTTEPGTACGDPARTTAELAERIAEAVRDSDRPRLHAELVGAGAAIVTGLTSVATAALRRLAAGPAPAGAQRLQERAQVADLLPNLPGSVVPTLIRHACGDAGTGYADPVDLAIGAAVLVARLTGTVLVG